MALKGDGKAALIALPGEKEVRLGGTFMVVSGRHRTVIGGGAACYEDSESERRNDIGSPGRPLRSANPTVRPGPSLPRFWLRPAMPFPWLAALRAPRFSNLRKSTSALNYSNIARYPSIQGFASSLAQTQPSFTLSSENVDILSRPTDFYTRLIVRHSSRLPLVVLCNRSKSRT
jgi:hypothetical protein